MINEQDNNLIQQCLKGDDNALNDLINKYFRPVYGFVYQYVGSQNDAEDIVQESFLRAWRHLKRFDQKRSFKTWLFSIAKNAAIDFLRKKKHLSFSQIEGPEDNDILGQIPDPLPLPSELLERKDLATVLSRALSELPIKYQSVLFLYYQQNFNFREISESLNESLNTIKSRHRRALVVLRKILIKGDSEINAPK